MKFFTDIPAKQSTERGACQAEDMTGDLGMLRNRKKASAARG